MAEKRSREGGRGKTQRDHFVWHLDGSDNVEVYAITMKGSGQYMMGDVGKEALTMLESSLSP